MTKRGKVLRKPIGNPNRGPRNGDYKMEIQRKLTGNPNRGLGDGA